MTQQPQRPDHQDPGRRDPDESIPRFPDPLTGNLAPAADPWSAADPLPVHSGPQPDPTTPQPPPDYAATPPLAYPAPVSGYTAATPPPAYPAPVSGYTTATPPPAYPAPTSSYPAATPPVSGYPAATPQPHSYPPYYQQPYAAPARVKSLRVPAGMATTGLVLTIAYAIMLGAIGRPLSADLDPGALVIIVPGLVLAIAIFTIVTFLTWIHRASSNLWNTGHRMKWRPGWSIGAWLIPFANLVLPLLVFREIDRESRDHGPGLFAGWAVFWTFGLILERATDDTPSTGAYLLSLLVMPIAAIAAILLIRRITADQEERFIRPAAL